jgi:hypothetical protein
MRQRNDLHIGNALASEIPPTVVSRKAFVVVTPYHADPPPEADSRGPLSTRPFPTVLHTQHAFDDVRFACTVVKVEEAAVQTYLEEAAVSYDADLELQTRSARTDLAWLQVRWRVVLWN